LGLTEPTISWYSKTTISLTVTSDYQKHATQKLYRPWIQDEYKINDSDIKDKPWCTLGPSCGPLTPPLIIHPSICTYWTPHQSYFKVLFHAFHFSNCFLLRNLNDSGFCFDTLAVNNWIYRLYQLVSKC
jgi:hypothetical protein